MTSCRRGEVSDIKGYEGIYYRYERTLLSVKIRGFEIDHLSLMGDMDMKIVKRDYEKLIGEAVRSFGVRGEEGKLFGLIQELEYDFIDMKMWMDILTMKGTLDVDCVKGMKSVEEIMYYGGTRFQLLSRLHEVLTMVQGYIDEARICEVYEQAEKQFGRICDDYMRCVKEVRNMMYIKLKEV